MVTIFIFVYIFACKNDSYYSMVIPHFQGRASSSHTGTELLRQSPRIPCGKLPAMAWMLLLKLSSYLANFEDKDVLMTVDQA
jgi:hypothetical protein